MPHYLPRGTNDFDNVVTLATAHNFARDGFLRTHLLPNRRGSKTSLGDKTGTQCEGIGGTRHPIAYRSAFGQTVDASSLNNDCIYIHYPPLADWVFGLMASAGLDRPLHYKVLAIVVNNAFLFVFYLWLRHEVRGGAALAALVIAGTLPTFVKWADALYCHSFQFFFLAAVTLTWNRYLRTRLRSQLILTWHLLLCEALVSNQLAIFCMVLIAWLAYLEVRRPALAIVKLVAVQATAPLAAGALHIGLCLSLLGPSRTWSNLATTLLARATEGPRKLGVLGGMRMLSTRLSEDILPWPLMVLGLLVVVLTRKYAQADLRRSLALLLAFFVGGVSYWLLFPGTTAEHYWMMYRHLLPFSILLSALVADAVLLGLEAKRTRAVPGSHATPRPLAFRRSWPLLSCILSGLAFFVAILFNNAQYAFGDVRWNLIRNRVVNRENLVRHHIEVAYWTDGAPRPAMGVFTMPVSGLRVHEPPGWKTDLRLVGPEAAYYEVWWLDDQSLKSINVLVDTPQTPEVLSHCFFSVLADESFRPLPQTVATATTPFLPSVAEPAPAEPFSWVQFSLPEPLTTRAIRLTCSEMKTIALHQIEATAI